MANVKRWFENELRRMLGFDEVEEIAKFALESFSTSQSVELRQYLHQFLGDSEEVNKLCDDLLAKRRNTGATSRSRALASANAGDDFWGGNSSLAARSTQKQPQTGRGESEKERMQNKEKAKGKLYQKAAAEDFWGGGPTPAKTDRSGAKGQPKSTPRPQRSPVRSPSAVAPGVKAPTIPSGRSRAESKMSDKASRAELEPEAPGKPRLAEGGARGVPTVTGKARGKADKQNEGPKAKGTRGPVAKAAGPTATAAPATRTASRDEATPRWSGTTCFCMAKKHDLVTNCTACGKIACVAEGGYGCSFCGSSLPVTGREPQNAGAGGSTAGSLRSSTGAALDAESPALKEALARKERLLLFDRTSASRTRVLDDQGDYFTSHNWLSQKEREKAAEEERLHRENAAQRRGARRQVKVSIDIMGRKVVEAREGGSDPEGEPDTLEASDLVSGDVALGDGSSGGNGGEGRGRRQGAAAAAEATLSSPTNDHRISLENKGLRGRAREVYAMMRANLDKQERLRSSKRGSHARGRVPDRSRLSLWRVQHDAAPDESLPWGPALTSAGAGVDASSGAMDGIACG